MTVRGGGGIVNPDPLTTVPWEDDNRYTLQGYPEGLYPPPTPAPQDHTTYRSPTGGTTAKNPDGEVRPGTPPRQWRPNLPANGGRRSL